MSESSTIPLQRCLDRLRAGDVTARDEVLEWAAERLQRLTRKMLNDFPGVRRWEETGDVLQNAMLRLCRALSAVSPATPRDFFRLAALQIRRELIDLSRYYYGPEGTGANHASAAETPDPATPVDRAELTWESSRLAEWTDFHEQAGSLPDDEREVFDLIWYQGLPQEEAAAVVGVSLKTIARRWRAARLKLHEALGGRLPGV